MAGLIILEISACASEAQSVMFKKSDELKLLGFASLCFLGLWSLEFLGLPSSGRPVGS